MAAYSNYQMPQFAQPPAQPYGQPPPAQQQPPQYSPYAASAPPQGQQQFFPHGGSVAASAPPGQRMAPRRSLSMGSSRELQQSMVSFDPYASTQAPPAAAQPPPAYNNYGMSAPPAPSSPYASAPVLPGAPPSFTNEEMTTSPMTQSQFGFAQSAPPQQTQMQPFGGGASTVSDISMFSSAPPSAMVPAKTEELGNVDPKLVAEQQRILQDIQARNKMQEIRKSAGLNNNQSNSTALVPRQPGRPGAPPRTRSMPQSGRSAQNSLARGGVAVLDPKKDMRKQTRKMKTAGGAVGGAVVGGLILGPVGVVLGAGGGAAVSNKMAKSRDKRKQAEFEQKNFQKGASQSIAAKGQGSFV